MQIEEVGLFIDLLVEGQETILDTRSSENISFKCCASTSRSEKLPHLLSY